MQVAFAAIATCLASLKQQDSPGHEAAFERALGILDSLARVKSCVIVVDLGDSVTVPFFTALLGAIQ